MKFIGRNKFETNRFYLKKTQKEENNNDLGSYFNNQKGIFWWI